MSLWNTNLQAQGRAVQGNAANQLSNQGYQNQLHQGQLGAYDTHVRNLQMENHRLQTEINAFNSVRRQDEAVRNVYYKTMRWLQDAHPEIVEEYHAMIKFLEASGEKL